MPIMNLMNLKKKIKKTGMTKEADEKASSELKKLQMMSPMSAEATVVRNFLDVLVSAHGKRKQKQKYHWTRHMKF
ncbi:MAG: hypothetical protein Ct9H90mP13_11790 [Pseudomonadota bacterium]|nr:MAG: hypothetical protein Ct9H90mP13_11790 [Pseudomonadota bacterium]